MGTTIHYRGKVNNTDDVKKLTEELEDFYLHLSCKSKRWDNDWSKPNTAKITNNGGKIRITGHIPLKGIDLFPHEDCEPLSLTFTAGGRLVSVVGMSLIASGKTTVDSSWMSTKTQFAPVETHITIVKLLEYLGKRYIHNLEVHNDGGYWKTGDIDELKHRRDVINRGIDMLENRLFALPAKSTKGKSPEEIADMIEKMLKNIFKPPDDDID